MTKFKNRKGLALGSIFALVVSAFVGVAPAKAAAGDLIVEPAYGPATNFTALASDSASISGIVLNTTYKTGVSAANLKYKVRILTADLDAASVSYQALVSESTAVAVPGLAGTFSAVTEAAYGDANYTYFDQTKVFYHTNDTLMGNASAYNLLRLAANRTDGETSSFQVEVTAWNDSVDNNMIDSSEVNTSVPVTVTFVHPEAVALGVAVTQPTLGDSTISARITMGGLNLQNYIEVAGGAPHIQAGVSLTSTTIDGSSSSKVVTYDADTDTLAAALDVSGMKYLYDTVSADVYYFYAKFAGAAEASTLVDPWDGNVASALSTSVEVVAATVATYSLQVVTGTTVAQDTGMTGADNIKALTGTKTHSFKFAG
jgi:hypothetical protein